MTYKIIFLVFLLTLTSCSTFKRTALVSTLAGSLVGGIGGAVFSPTKEDTPKNAFVFSALGAAIGGGVTYALKESEKKPLPPMLQEPLETVQKDIKEPLYEFNGVNLTPKIELKPVGKYTLEDKTLPKELQKHVPKRNLIEYYVPEKIIHHQGKTIKIESHRAFEIK